jgi:cytoskeletal protein CcmA (bactofilin family)
MFGKNGRDDSTPSIGQVPSGNAKRGSSSGFSIIGPDVVVIGNVRASSDLHVEGRIEGDLDCGNLIQGAESHIKGEVRATSARIAGTIEGSVAINQLVIESGARIIGDVDYNNVTIENGAHVDGRLKHLSTLAAPTPALAAPRAMTIVDVENEAAE